MSHTFFPASSLLASPCAALALSLILSPASRAQLPDPVTKPVTGARMPALSPDGKTLAFVWRGDIWVTSTGGGGAAYPVTSHVEFDAYPIFSPDGKWIAFASYRNGNADIFVVPTTGGAVRQLTFSAGNEVPTDWSPDGKSLLFAGSRDTPNPSVFELDVKTLRFTKLAEDFKGLSRPAYGPGGKSVVFVRGGFPWTRPRYAGSAAAQLVTLEKSTGKRNEITSGERQKLFPRYLPDGRGILCVTASETTPNAQWANKPLPKLADTAAKTPNLYAYSTDGKNPKALTKFVGGSVRYPSVASQSGEIAFEYESDIYLLPARGGEPKKLTLFCAGDDKTSTKQRFTVDSAEVDEAEISPDGKTFAFLTRNDVWTIPVEKSPGRNANDAARLTEWDGYDRDFNWARDNKTLFFVSDRDGNDRVFAIDTTTRKIRPVWTGTADARGPKISPDGKVVGFWVRGKTDTAGFYTAPVDGSAPPKRLLAIEAPRQGDFSWSPDTRWIAYTRGNQEMGGFNIYIAPANGEKPGVNVTRLNAFHSNPTFSPDGKYLLFGSNRDGDALYTLPLKPEDARTDELEIKYVKPTTPVNVEIDFTDIAQRVRKLVPQDPDEIAVNDDGAILFVSGGDIFQTGYDGKSVNRLTTGGGASSLRIVGDGKSAFFRRGGQLFQIRFTAPGNPQIPIRFVASGTRDLAAERRAAFNQFWREYNNRFYDNNFHGRDWAAIRARYEPQMDSVGTRHEFSILLNRMVGELEASHAEVGIAPGPAGPSGRNLGVYFDYGYVGPGVRVKSVPNRAPGSFAKTKISAGEYIVAIDGKDVTLDENLFTLLNDKGDRDFVLLVNSKPGRDGAREVKYRALTQGEWDDIHYRNRVEARRKRVEELSGGKLAYVHIAGMGGPNQTTFERELYEYADGKEGVVIDVRENGGGNIGDRLISWLNLRPYAQFQPRDGQIIPAPNVDGRAAWNKSIVVLMAESSFSNAEMFPYGMRASGLAKLVGKPTPGYVIWTNELPLVDGTGARMPGSGVFRKDGSPLENLGEKPDLDVDLTVDDFLANRDPQLDAAVRLLLKK